MQLVMSCFPFSAAKPAALVYTEKKYLLIPLLYSLHKCQDVILIKCVFLLQKMSFLLEAFDQLQMAFGGF